MSAILTIRKMATVIRKIDLPSEQEYAILTIQSEEHSKIRADVLKLCRLRKKFSFWYEAITIAGEKVTFEQGLLYETEKASEI